MTSAVINIIADAKRFEKVRYNQRCVAEYEEMWFMTSFRERKTRYLLLIGLTRDKHIFTYRCIFVQVDRY